MPDDLILDANQRFYRALSLADFQAMEKLWVLSAEAVCVHPGWPPLYGWEAIRESWLRIFANQGPIHLWASEAQLRVYGQTAEVICLENIDAGQVQGSGLLQTRANNLFRLVNAEWKLLEHHATTLRSEKQARLKPFSHN